MPHGLRARIQTWALRERGASSVEYALMVALIAVVIVGAVTMFGVAVNGLFSVPWP